VSITDGWGETAEVTGDDGVLDPGALPGGVRPDDEPKALPAAFECDVGGFERHPQMYEGAVSWGAGGGAGHDAGDATDGDGPLALRVVIPGDAASEPLTVDRGTAFRIELTNVSGREVYVGNRGSTTSSCGPRPAGPRSAAPTRGRRSATPTRRSPSRRAERALGSSR
jgi:hypothetical protein